MTPIKISLIKTLPIKTSPIKTLYPIKKQLIGLYRVIQNSTDKQDRNLCYNGLTSYEIRVPLMIIVGFYFSNIICLHNRESHSSQDHYSINSYLACR